MEENKQNVNFENINHDDKEFVDKNSVESKKDQTTNSINKNITMAFLAYIFFAIPLLTNSKDDIFVKYHVKQSLGLLIAWIVVSVFTMVPLVGWVFGPILGLVLFIFWILGVINALTGVQKPLPLIGQHAEKLNF